ncbi:unnamed protein product, partial [marine sediment metagenome]
MATVQIKEPREQEAHFGLYRTTAGGDETIFVRRKIGEPTDYMHTKSRKLKRQRDNLALASQHYSHLTPTQKATIRHQAEEVEYQKSHGKTDTKVLQGRELFISNEIRSLATTQKQLQTPLELCITLTDELENPLDLETRLAYYVLGWPRTIPGIYLTNGNTLFLKLPTDKDIYRLGYVTSGTFGNQIFTYKFLELLRIQSKSVAPNVEAHYGAPWILPTHPPSFDWEAATSLGPPYLWTYHVHQPTGVEWNKCYPWRAFTLRWQKIESD